MNASPDCPEKSKLVDYLLGKLPVLEIEFCEGHIAQCDVCEDTVRGLNVNDTLDELTRQAFSNSDLHSSSEVVGQLLEAVRDIPQLHCQGHDRLTLERSAEITRHLSPTDDAAAIGKVGRYRVIDLLGAGSTGVVYRAIDENLDREVALKILRPSLGSIARTRFLAEAKSAAAVDHENVITIYEVGEDGTLAFMAMQILPGETLDARLQREAMLSEEVIRNIASDIASGLAAAHEKDLIHRDIKPANIWLTDDNKAKILDFGLARVVDDDPGFTSTGMIAGTPSYMSPEQSKGHALDARSDLFSLGCILYRGSTGRQPFGAANVLATLQAIQSTDPVPPADTTAKVPQELSDLTMCMLEKLPANRPGTAVDVAKALKTPKSEWTFPVSDYSKRDRDGAALVATSQQSMLPAPPTKSATGMGWFGLLATTLLIGLLGAGGFLFGSDIIRIATGHGQLTIETDDPNIKIELLENGKVVRIIDTLTEKKIDIKEGKYTLQVAGEQNSIQVVPNDFSITRGGKEIARVFSGKETGEAASPAAASAIANDGGAISSKLEDREMAVSTTNRTHEEEFDERQSEHKKRIEKLKLGLNSSEQKYSYELASAELEQLEDEIQFEFRYGRRLDRPEEIAMGHDLLQQQLALLKRQNVALLPKLSGEEGDSESWRNYRLLKTKRSLATNRLTSFEGQHGLPNSQPRFEGKTLFEHLEIIETERDVEQLAHAYLGTAKLVDQFGTRGEFTALVHQLCREHGNLIHPSAGSSLRTAVVECIDKLEDPEFKELIENVLVRDGTESSREFAATLMRMGYRDRMKRAFKSADSLYVAILESSPEQASSLISSAVQYKLVLPESTDLRKRAAALLLEAESNSGSVGRSTTRYVSVLDPENELLPGLVETFISSYPGDAMHILHRFDPDSVNAQKSVPLLVRVASSNNRESVAWKDSAMPVFALAFEFLAKYAASDSAAEAIAGEISKLAETDKEIAINRLFKVAKRMEIEVSEPLVELKRRIQADASVKAMKEQKAAKERATKTQVTVYSLQHVGDVTDVIQALLSNEPSESTKLLRVKYDESSNTLVVVGTKENHDRITEILKMIDREPRNIK